MWVHGLNGSSSLKQLMEADEVIGHNIITFDILRQKVFVVRPHWREDADTWCLSPDAT